LSLVAKARIEIFRSPKLLDDHFCKNWALASGGTSSWSKDGDIATINSGDQPYGSIQRAVNIVTNDFGKLIVRIPTGSGEWLVSAYDGSNWLTLLQGTGSGVFEADLPSGKTLVYVVLNSVGVGVTAKFDYIAICKYALLVPDLGDIIEELTVVRPVLRRGVSSANFVIPNFGGTYNGLISEKDVVIIWQSWTEGNLGNANYKTFGGTVVKPGNKAQNQGAFYVTVDCEGWAAELNVPPALLQKMYTATNGRTIIEDALGVCGYLSRHPTDAKWFDAGGASGATDDRINSTHDVTYDEVKPLTVIQEIAEKAKNPAGLQGFDLYETPAGCLVGHLRNSLDFSGLSFVPRTYARSSDSHRVRNKKKVYGAKTITFPSPEDSWGESVDGWSYGIGETLVLEANDRQVGSYSLKHSGTLVQLMMLTRSEWSGIAMAIFKNQFQKFPVWFKLCPSSGAPTKVEIRFHTAALGWFEHVFRNPPANSWFKIEVDLKKCGLGNGAPDWANITKVALLFENNQQHSGYWLVDWPHFAEKPCFGEAEDATSQGKYGVCVDEPEVDEALQTNAECQVKAQALVAFLKDPTVTFTDAVTDGDYRYRPSERQQIVVANDNILDYFPAVEVQHKVKNSQWDTVLTLADEPQYLDLVFRMLEEKKRLLERR
jgi:hypothetical protein